MATTNFTGPLSVGQKTGDPTTDTRGFARLTKQVSLGSGADSRKTVSFPGKVTILNLAAVPSSAFGPSDQVASAARVSFGTSSDATRYGIVPVSGLGVLNEVRASAGTDFDAATIMVLALSAQTTTTFTSGGARAFIEYIQVE